MTAKFAPDHRLCEVTIEKRHVKSSGAILLDETFMSPDEMKPIVDELVPLSERGQESKLSGDITIIGGGMTTTYNYENVRISYYGAVDRERNTKNNIVVHGTAAIVIQWNNRGCN